MQPLAGHLAKVFQKYLTALACGGTIDAGSLRIGEAVPSDYHDGFDNNNYHFKCCNKKSAAPSFSKIEDLKEWEILRWEDQEDIRKSINQPVPKNDVEAKRERVQ